MTALPLYPTRPQGGVSSTEPLAPNTSCTLCPAYRNATSVCLMDASLAAGRDEEGGLLIVSDYPSEADERAGNTFSGATGLEIRGWVERSWEGTIAYANALKCRPGKEEKLEPLAALCRGYLAWEIKRLKPSRILVLGALALYAVTGEKAPGEPSKIQNYSLRRGVYYLSDMTPVYVSIHPRAGTANRFFKEALRSDIEWACKEEPAYKPAWDATYQVISTLEEAEAAAEVLRKAPYFSFDIEASGQMFADNYWVLCVGVSPYLPDREVAYIWPRSTLKTPIFEPLKKLLEDENLRKTAQNAKYDMEGLKCGLGVDVKGLWADTLLWRRLLDTNALGGLPELSWLVSMGGMKEEAELELAKLKKQVSKEKTQLEQRTMLGNGGVLAKCPPGTVEGLLRGDRPEKYLFAALPLDLLHRYNARDVVSTTRVTKLLFSQLKQEGNLHLLENCWNKILKETSATLAQVEAWGFAVDRAAIEQYSGYLTVKLDDVTKRLSTYGLTDPGSNALVSTYVYKTLGLKVKSKTASGAASVDADALEALVEAHPQLTQLNELLEWRRLSKLRSTYAESFLDLIRPDGRVHTTFNIDGTVTLRLSSSEPNLQNLPRSKSSPEAKMSRACFVASPRCILLELDYNQQEVRIGANLANDEVMQAIFAEGVDFHRRTAEMVAPMVWGAPLATFSKDKQDEYRSLAKTLVFGVFYGMGIPSLAAQMGCSKEMAQKVYDAILGQFRKLRSWITQSKAFANHYGYCTTWWEGEPLHRRLLWDIASTNKGPQGTAERSSYNTRVQGTGAAFMLASLNEVVRWIKYDGVPAKVVCTIHDSMVIDVREDAAQEVAWKAKQIMEGWDNGACPLRADIKAGYSFGSMTDYRLE